MEDLIREAYTQRLLSENEMILDMLSGLDREQPGYEQKVQIMEGLIKESSADYRNYLQAMQAADELNARYVELDQKAAEAQQDVEQREKELDLRERELTARSLATTQEHNDRKRDRIIQCILGALNAIVGVAGIVATLSAAKTAENGLNYRFNRATEKEDSGEPILGFTDRATVTDGLKSNRHGFFKR